MRLKIAARQSDLSRIQAHMVAKALIQIEPNLQIEFIFKTSLGDRELDLSLTQSQQKGVFTEDFYEDLLKGEYDLVVHSWKDLPIEKRTGVEVVSTLARADMRDLLLVKKSSRSFSCWRVLSSSPRRSYNLQRVLSNFLPSHPEIQFLPVRGNVPTRFKKLMSEQGDALLVAKAAIDRLLTAREEEFSSTQAWIKEVLASCDWCVLPLSLNPAAAAQGALAIEIATHRSDLRVLLSKVNCQTTFAAVQREREILASYGGGCHQKLGISLFHRPYGQVESIRGLTETGEKIEVSRIVDFSLPASWQTKEENMFPFRPQQGQWFERKEKALDDLKKIKEKILEKIKTEKGKVAVWITRTEALPQEWKDIPFKMIWASGLKSWRDLASRGIWVNGCAESLGEHEPLQLEALGGKGCYWFKLSHDSANQEIDFDLNLENQLQLIPTYQLTPSSFYPDLNKKTHFFWMSGSSFLRARELYPQLIEKGYHGCGPGNTYKILKRFISNERLRLFLNHENWRQLTLKTI